MRPTAGTPLLLLRVALVVIAWAISEPLLLSAEGADARLRALGFGLLVAVPLLAARRVPVLVAMVVVSAYLVQYVTGQRTSDAMSPELSLAFALFCISAYAPAESRRRFLAVPLALAAPAGLWAASVLDLGEIETVATVQYLYLAAVVTAGVLPGLALRGRHSEVAALEREVEALCVEAAIHIGEAARGERRQLGGALTRVVTELVGDIEVLAANARTSLAVGAGTSLAANAGTSPEAGAGPSLAAARFTRPSEAVGSAAAGETAALGRAMAAAAGQAGDELRTLLRTLTAEGPETDPAAKGLRARVDPRALLGLVFPTVGLAVLGVVDRLGTMDLPATVATSDGQTLSIAAPLLPTALGFALTILTPLALIWRRRHPVLAIEVTGGLLVLQVALGELTSLNITQVFTCGVLAYLAGAWPRTLPSAALAGGIALASTVGCWLLEQYRFDPVVYAYMVGVLIGAWAVGRAVRDDLRDALALRDRARVLRLQRDRLCEVAISGERRDVAREMHDVVGHGLSLIIVQAGVVDVLAPRDPARALDALRVVEGAARSTQAELGPLQAALADDRPSRDGAGRDRPSWVARVSAIVDDARAVGQPVIAWVDPRLDDASGEVGGALVRIVQEALTNVRKHAGAAATTLELSVRGDRVELSVTNETGRRLVGVPRGANLGIVGMAARAEALGGVAYAGPGGAAGWTVRVQIPFGAGHRRVDPAVGQVDAVR